MRDFLTFQIYGAMAAWGDIAVGETRRSAAHPSKSAILGLLSAALGITREDETTHRKMAAAYGFGCKVISIGSMLIDYHTVQVPPQQRKIVMPTRKAELASDKLGTLLSSREYRCEAAYIVAIWANEPAPPFTLQQIAEALEKPAFALYLGRKSCPLALPLKPLLTEKTSLKAALDGHQELESTLDNYIRLPQSRQYYWENFQDPSLKAEQHFERWDVPISRKRWQFSSRGENLYVEHKEV